MDLLRGSIFSHRSPASLALLLAVLVLVAGAAALADSYRLQETYLGEILDDQFGFAVAAAGDVNGDGFGDFLVGANVNDQEVTSGGKVYLFLGGGSYPDAAGPTFTGDLERGYVGGAVAGGADLNQDGYDDWVAGAPGPGTDGNHPGRVYVFLGGPEPDALPDLILQGQIPGAQFGAAVCLLPDLDGDGFGDLAVGSPRAGDGRVTIFRGGPLPLDGDPDQIFHARPDDNRFGRALACLPDQDADERDELLVGVPRSFEQAAWAGAVLVYLGSAALDTVADLVLLGENAGDEFGSSLAAASDLDGDGEPDLLVGAPLANAGGQVDAGKAYLFRAGSALDAVSDLTLTGSSGSDWFGKSVAAGFDFNGDGTGDLAVGVSGHDDNSQDDVGAGFVFLGGDLLDALVDTTVIGTVPGGHLGTSMVSAGNVRGNGRGAWLIGGHTTGDSGRVLLFGSDRMPAAVPAPLADLEAWLDLARPNPFNPRVQTELHLLTGGHWRVTLFDLRGRVAAVLRDGFLAPGSHRLAWDGCLGDGRAAPAGTYLLRARGAGRELSASLTLVR